jgi:beta-lactam-binding protein with PASTA domain
VRAFVRPAPARRWRPRVPQRVATYFNERKILKYVVLTGLGSFLLGYLFITLLFFPFGRSAIVTVPDVRGKTLAQARRAFDRVGLEVQIGDSLSHPTLRVGRVLAQVPLPGQEAARGSEVEVIVSQGPERRAVPSITGLGKDDAVALLQRMGFRVRLASVVDNSPEGKLLGMEPRAGTRVPMPGTVTLTLSAGPPRVAVPSVFALDAGDAAARLEAVGLRLGRVGYDSLSAEPRGTVVSQSPAAGDSLRMGSAVRVVLAGPDPDPPPVVVPVDSLQPAEPGEPAEPPAEPEPEPPPAPKDTIRVPERRR